MRKARVEKDSETLAVHSVEYELSKHETLLDMRVHPKYTDCCALADFDIGLAWDVVFFSRHTETCENDALTKLRYYINFAVRILMKPWPRGLRVSTLDIYTVNK